MEPSLNQSVEKLTVQLAEVVAMKERLDGVVAIAREVEALKSEVEALRRRMNAINRFRNGILFVYAAALFVWVEIILLNRQWDLVFPWAMALFFWVACFVGVRHANRVC